MNRIDRSRRRLAIAAAGLAGFVDAAGFLSANSYFVSFMSGNTTRLGVDLAQRPGHAWVPAALIAGFVTGVTGGAVLAAKAGARRKQAIFSAVAALLAMAALAHHLRIEAAMLGLLVLAMGAINNSFQRGGEVSVGLTYMTGALVRMGQGLAARLMGTGGEAWAGSCCCGWGWLAERSWERWAGPMFRRWRCGLPPAGRCCWPPGPHGCHRRIRPSPRSRPACRARLRRATSAVVTSQSPAPRPASAAPPRWPCRPRA